jgi:site-specific DNA-methyltransferase (cytosine-N4-specific)
VLKEYSAAQLELYRNGFNAGIRPSHHRVSKNGFNGNNGGAIPPNVLPVENLLSIANTASTDRYLDACREKGLVAHPARFPVAIPHFFINLLTEPGDLVLDPFAGSNSVGAVAEELDRRWLSCESDAAYVEASRFRFSPLPRNKLRKSPVVKPIVRRPTRVVK